jgi:hypothetical protein
MADDTKIKAKKWPTSLKEEDELYAVVDSTNSEVKYLVYVSSDKNATFVRDNASWVRVFEVFTEEIDDPDLYNENVEIDFIDYYDNLALAGSKVPLNRAESGLTAAVSDCPPPTQDIGLNLKNRKNAIDTAMYGPLNPAEPNTEYWQKIADEWSVDLETAKKQRCGNCAVFVITSQMKDCIKKGLAVPGGVAYNFDNWDKIDEAGELGYCEAFDFKCASARTCRAWVGGGPVKDDIK